MSMSRKKIKNEWNENARLGVVMVIIGVCAILVLFVYYKLLYQGGWLRSGVERSAWYDQLDEKEKECVVEHVRDEFSFAYYLWHRMPFASGHDEVKKLEQAISDAVETCGSIP